MFTQKSAGRRALTSSLVITRLGLVLRSATGLDSPGRTPRK
jgi:hypothetical protein